MPRKPRPIEELILDHFTTVPLAVGDSQLNTITAILKDRRTQRSLQYAGSQPTGTARSLAASSVKEEI